MYTGIPKINNDWLRYPSEQIFECTLNLVQLLFSADINDKL